MLKQDISMENTHYNDKAPLIRRSNTSDSFNQHYGSMDNQLTPGGASPNYKTYYKKPPLTRWEKISYGLGEGGLSIFQVIKGFFLNTFLLSVAQLPPLFSGIILFTTKAVDAFSDIFVGNLSDKTVSRFGRRRVWILFGALPLSILYTALWYVPPWEQIPKLLYYQIVVILLSIAYTCVAIPYSAMNAELSDDYDERTSLAGLRMISLMLGGVISSFVHSILIKVFKKDVNGTEIIEYEKGYLLSGGVWGFIMMIPLAITFFGTRKVKCDKPSDSHVPFFKGLAVMFSNRAFITVTLLYFFCQIAVQFVQNNLLLYCKYVADAEDQFSYILATLQISVSIFIVFWGKISTIIGKKTVYYIGGAFLMAAFISLYFIPTGNMKIVWAVAAFGGIGVSVAFLVPMSMLPDVVELDELQTGERREGIFYSLFLFFQKMGLSVGLGVSNLVLSWAGYTAPEEVVTDGLSTEIVDNNIENQSVILALRLLVSAVPAVFVLFSFFAVFFYPITKNSHNETRELLKRKREGATVMVDN